MRRCDVAGFLVALATLHLSHTLPQQENNVWKYLKSALTHNKRHGETGSIDASNGMLNLQESCGKERTIPFLSPAVFSSDGLQYHRHCAINIKAPKHGRIFMTCPSVGLSPLGCKREHISIENHGNLCGSETLSHSLSPLNVLRLVHHREQMNLAEGEVSGGFVCLIVAIPDYFLNIAQIPSIQVERVGYHEPEDPCNGFVISLGPFHLVLSDGKQTARKCKSLIVGELGTGFVGTCHLHMSTGGCTSERLVFKGKFQHNEKFTECGFKNELPIRSESNTLSVHQIRNEQHPQVGIYSSGFFCALLSIPVDEVNPSTTTAMPTMMPTSASTTIVHETTTTTAATTSVAPAGSSKSNDEGICEKCGVGAVAQGRRGKIFRGSDVLEGAMPWMAFIEVIEHGHERRCAGSVIVTGWVLTSATCIPQDFTNGNNDGGSIKVRLGSVKISSAAQYEVSYAVRHPSYEPSGTFASNYYNIGLIKLDSSPSDITPACISRNWDPEIGVTATVAGWGEKEDETSTSEFANNEFSPAETLQQTDLKIISNSDCSHYYTASDFDQMCARQDLRGPCYGDIGAPLMVKIGSKLRTVGVLIEGFACGRDSIPSLYTRVSWYHNWIATTVGNNCP